MRHKRIRFDQHILLLLLDSFESAEIIKCLEVVKISRLMLMISSRNREIGE